MSGLFVGNKRFFSSDSFFSIRWFDVECPERSGGDSDSFSESNVLSLNERKTCFMLQFLEKFRLFGFQNLTDYLLKNNISKQSTCLNLILKNHQSIIFLLVISAIKNYVV